MAVDFDPENTKVTAVRSLRDSGNSTIISLPPQALKMLDWESGDEMNIEADWSEGELTLSLNEPEEE